MVSDMSKANSSDALDVLTAVEAFAKDEGVKREASGTIAGTKSGRAGDPEGGEPQDKGDSN
jgi:hypothetical protein